CGSGGGRGGRRLMKMTMVVRWRVMVACGIGEGVVDGGDDDDFVEMMVRVAGG
nr:hypothetical protein [Tanacetum cinerariifolium]